MFTHAMCDLQNADWLLWLDDQTFDFQLILKTEKGKLFLRTITPFKRKCICPYLYMIQYSIVFLNHFMVK